MRKAKPAKKERYKPIIYLGPTIKDLKSNTIFTAPLSETAKALIKCGKKYLRLFVPLKDFAVKRQEVKNGCLRQLYKSAEMEVIE